MHRRSLLLVIPTVIVVSTGAIIAAMVSLPAAKPPVDETTAGTPYPEPPGVSFPDWARSFASDETSAPSEPVTEHAAVRGEWSAEPPGETTGHIAWPSPEPDDRPAPPEPVAAQHAAVRGEWSAEPPGLVLDAPAGTSLEGDDR